MATGVAEQFLLPEEIGEKAKKANWLLLFHVVIVTYASCSFFPVG